MKAQDLPLNNRELRLGNLVLIDGKICTVDHLYGQYIRTKEMPSIIDAYRDAYGIELTPEALGWCGFVFKDNNGLYVNNDVWLETRSGKNFTPVYSDGSSFKRPMGRHIKYLHQLQNLYYALTGEELTISLPTVKMEEK